MPFRYLRDPLFMACLGLYAGNRWVLKVHWPHSFFSAHLNDLICIPFWVPLMLLGARWLRLRADDAPPRSYEILVPLFLWTWVFEGWLPYTVRFRGVATADVLDVLYYVIGAALAALIWAWIYRARQATAPPT